MSVTTCPRSSTGWSTSTNAETLARTGQLENTYIVFVGGNGYVLGQHRISKGKYFPYEPALNIPFIVRGPGVRAGVTFDQMVTLMDVTPTILDLADAKATGREPDGLSLKAALQSGTPIVDRTLLLSSGPQQSPAGTSCRVASAPIPEPTP